MQSQNATSIRRHIMIRDYHSDVPGITRTRRSGRKVLFLLMVLTQAWHILHRMRPVHSDLRRNVPYVLTQRYVLLMSRLRQIVPVVASSA